MTDQELMQMALDAMRAVSVDEHLCNAAHHVKKDRHGIDEPCPIAKRFNDIAEALRARLAQPEPEPVAWVAYENGEKHGIDFDEDEIAELPVGTMLYPIPLHFLDPAKVARLIDEAFERGKKEIDMEQVKDIAQKLADCALLNSAPPQPKQEPVAWTVRGLITDFSRDFSAYQTKTYTVPLYTAPPQRECEICGKVAKP